MAGQFNFTAHSVRMADSSSVRSRERTIADGIRRMSSCRQHLAELPHHAETKAERARRENQRRLQVAEPGRAADRFRGVAVRDVEQVHESPELQAADQFERLLDTR